MDDIDLEKYEFPQQITGLPGVYVLVPKKDPWDFSFNPFNLFTVVDMRSQMTTPEQASDASSDSRPCVVVVIRTLGERSAMLAHALACVRSQDYPTKAVVVWDGPGWPSSEDPGDGTTAWIFTRSRRRTRAGNAGIAHALARLDAAFVLFLDDDDHIEPGHVSNLVQALEVDPGAGVAYSDSQEVACDPENRPIRKGYTYDRAFTENDLRREVPRPNHSFLIRKELLVADRFDESLEVSEDWDLWARLSARSRFVHAPGLTAEYRVRNDGSNTIMKQKDACGRDVAITRARLEGKA